MTGKEIRDLYTMAIEPIARHKGERWPFRKGVTDGEFLQSIVALLITLVEIEADKADKRWREGK